MHTSLQLRTANAMARNSAERTANEYLESAQRALNTARRLLEQMEEAGASKAEIAKVRDGILDGFSSIQGGINNVLAAENLVAEQHVIDVSELGA